MQQFYSTRSAGSEPLPPSQKTGYPTEQHFPIWQYPFRVFFGSLLTVMMFGVFGVAALGAWFMFGLTLAFFGVIDEPWAWWPF